MVFSTPVFLYLFLPAVLILYYLFPGIKVKNIIILISGLLFYSWGEPIYVVVMIISTMIDYFAGLIMNKFEGKKLPRRICLIVSICMNVGLLGIFKYGGFIFENINAVFGTSFNIHDMYLFGLDYLPMDLLPIGISFFTFQSMSYTIDLYLGNVKVQKNPISFAAFVTLFPQIVAGPIVRYNDVAAELDDRTITLDLIYDGVIKFIIGLSKKVLIANSIGSLWTAVKATDFGGLSVLGAWLGILAFTFQIYFDFSGYSDMAVGLGKMMGFNFPKNFDYPYMSKSISEFWRRWHITLGAWFRSYIYIPLGGNRKGLGRTVFNLAVVWVVTGIWHGASWNFVLWGTLYGVVIICERLFLGKLLDKLPAAIDCIYTMLLVVLGWVLFDTPDLPSAGAYISAMFGGTGILFDETALYHLTNYGLMFVICIIGCTDLPQRAVKALSDKLTAIVNYAGVAVMLAMFLLCTAYLVDETYNPFLYFNF